MRFGSMPGPAVAVAATATASLMGMTLLVWAGDRDGAPDQAKLVRRERLVDDGRTLVVELVNPETGRAEYCAAVDPRAEVQVDGERGLVIRPYDPTTESEMDRMAAALTPEIIARRRSACRESED